MQSDFHISPPASAMALLRYAGKHRRLPRLFPPRSFSDHIMHRLIFDRDPRLKIICDKVAVKAFVAGRVGENHVVPMLGAWTSGPDIPWQDLPETFVLKPSFLSGPYAFVGPETDRMALTAAVNGWLSKRPALRHYSEWGYHGIARRVLAEPLITAAGGGQAPEVDVHVFNGKALLLRVLTGRKLTDARRDAWFDRDGRQVAIGNVKIRSTAYRLDDTIRRELIEVGEAAARDFCFMRVDCYVAGDGIRVGELTPYPWGGRANWGTRQTDLLMGSLFQPNADTSAIEDFHE